MRRVVVTGLGMVSAIGNDVESSWDAARKGESGIRRIQSFDPDALTVKIAGEVKGFDVESYFPSKEVSRTSRFCQYAMAASQQAVEHSGIDYKTTKDTTRWGTILGVGIGGLENIEENTQILLERGPRRVSPFFLPYAIPNMAAGIVANRFNLKGPNLCIATACSSGTHALGESWRYIQSGIADVMVCGGAETAVSPLGIVAFANMKALSRDNDNPETASRPFDKTRNGFVMGEGAGVVVLESLEHAEKRGAHIIAEMVGYGSSADAHHITAPAPEGEGGQRCMKAALDSANITAEMVDYVNAHGTSTPMNDACESAAIMKVFGDHSRKLAISSTKGVTGHCLGAAGGIEAVLMAKTIEKQVAPPTANYTEADPECPLDYVIEGPRDMSIKYAISNSFGFGGTNATIVMKQYH